MTHKKLVSKVLAAFLFVTVFLTAYYGCKRKKPESELPAKIDAALATLEAIEMTTEDHPWEVLHGVYHFGVGYEILDTEKDRQVNALRNVCCMPTAKQFIQVDEYGPLFVDAAGELEADTHRNMFLSILSAVEVPLHHQFDAFDSNVYPLWRFLDKAMLEIDLNTITESEEVLTGNYGNELGWTLSAFSLYLPLDHKWKNKNGEWVTLEDVLAVSITRTYGWGTCFGTHELYGIAVALYRREQQGLPMTGAWADAREYLDGAIQLVKSNLNPDGSISPAWHKEKAAAKNKKLSIYATGHTLEWLVLALPQQKLQEPWVERLVEKLSDDIINHFDSIRTSHSVSTHAGHALAVYKERVELAEKK